MIQKSDNPDNSNPTENSRNEDETVEFNLPLLQPLSKAPLGGGIPTYILGPQDKIDECMNLHLSFGPVYKISNEEIKEQWEFTLNYAARGLDRPKLTKLLHANRILFKQIFVKELGLLDCLMYQMLRGEYFGLDDEGNEVKMYVYSFDLKHFTQLNIILRPSTYRHCIAFV